MNNIYARWLGLSAKFSAAPVILKMYCIFATLATSYMVFSSFIFPMIGWKTIWPGPAVFFGYMFGLYFVYACIFSNERANKIGLRMGMIATLLTNLFTFAAYNNSSLHHTNSMWLMVWTVILPVFWTLMLMTKTVTRFLQGGSHLNK